MDSSSLSRLKSASAAAALPTHTGPNNSTLQRASTRVTLRRYCEGCNRSLAFSLLKSFCRLFKMSLVVCADFVTFLAVIRKKFWSMKYASKCKESYVKLGRYWNHEKCAISALMSYNKNIICMYLMHLQLCTSACLRACVCRLKGQHRRRIYLPM